MKRKTILALTVVCAIIMHSSCYKTGETIYQPECKPDSLFVFTPLYNFWYLHQEFTFNGSLNYDVNRRLISATTITGGMPDRHYDFIYDNNNNLIRINGSVYSSNTLTLILYVTFSYPSGTTASISSTAQVQLNFLVFNNLQWVAAPVQTYNFNAQFQLVSKFQGSQRVEQLTYDNGGNCLADSVNDPAQNLVNYFVYNSYDNEINPARSDRSIQLFFQMYSKNNPTSSNEYEPGAGLNNFILTNSSVGNYTYNGDGYPITYGGSHFADYNCLPPPTSAPAAPGVNEKN
ncbi:MAG TPA: hypothetical protein VK772_03135 [Puia sp.]|nr:hypothetical protein [Puia sp.]